jgi:hypothetical protein
MFGLAVMAFAFPLLSATSLLLTSVKCLTVILQLVNVNSTPPNMMLVPVKLTNVLMPFATLRMANVLDLLLT